VELPFFVVVVLFVMFVGHLGGCEGVAEPGGVVRVHDFVLRVVEDQRRREPGSVPIDVRLRRDVAEEIDDGVDFTRSPRRRVLQRQPAAERQADQPEMPAGDAGIAQRAIDRRRDISKIRRYVKRLEAS